MDVVDIVVVNYRTSIQSHEIIILVNDKVLGRDTVLARI